jgi:ribonucleoside-triphosphate reductase
MDNELELYVVKRDGKKVPFDRQKIYNAIEGAARECDSTTDDELKHLTDQVVNKCLARIMQFDLSVEAIQDMVEDTLMENNYHDIARHYIKYRQNKEIVRASKKTDDEILALVDCRNEEANEENSNKNPTLVSTQRDYIAGIVSKDIARRRLLPEDVVKAHDAGLIHVHDMDYTLQRLTNCCLVNLDDMLQNGTMIGGAAIEKPHSFSTACNIACQIALAVSAAQYGGQTWSYTPLAKFVDVSRQAIRKEVYEELEGTGLSIDKLEEIVESRLKKEITRGIQTIQYQILTMSSCNGQSPFVSTVMYLNEAEDDKQLKHDLAMVIEEVIRQRYQGIKNEKGVWISPAFPKLIYCLEEDNVHENSKYFYLTQMAAKCSAKRLVPDYVSEKKLKEYKIAKGQLPGTGDAVFPMGCRSFLSVDETRNGWNNIARAKNYDGKPKYYGRFNKAVVTINLPDVGLSAHKNMNEFWRILDERLELCHKALLWRYKHLLGTKSDAAPILWQHGALARLNKGETIDALLKDGYSTISLGYAGIYECVMAMLGVSHTTPEGKQFAIEILKHLNDKCDEWNAECNMGASLYGAPIESTTYKFAEALKKHFGIIDGITDHDYVTNSYHISVREPIDAFSKLSIEGEFQKYSLAGCISYVELPSMDNNIEAVIKLIQHIYDNCMYAELNTKSDYCQACGFDGEIQIVEDEHGHLDWECPRCGNRDHNTLTVTRRTCGKHSQHCRNTNQ